MTYGTEVRKPCPLCGEELRGQDYYGGAGLEEAYWQCPSGHYNYEFAHGGFMTVLQLNGLESLSVMGHHADSPAVQTVRNRMLNEYITYAQLRELPSVERH